MLNKLHEISQIYLPIKSIPRINTFVHLYSAINFKKMFMWELHSNIFSYIVQLSRLL